MMKYSLVFLVLFGLLHRGYSQQLPPQTAEQPQPVEPLSSQQQSSQQQPQSGKQQQPRSQQSPVAEKKQERIQSFPETSDVDQQSQFEQYPYDDAMYYDMSYDQQQPSYDAMMDTSSE